MKIEEYDPEIAESSEEQDEGPKPRDSAPASRIYNLSFGIKKRNLGF